MEYLKNQIVIFKDGTKELTGVIQEEIKDGEDKYFILDLGSRKHFKKESEIIKCVGSVYVNEARKKAESWTKEKRSDFYNLK
jgi:hypothetical protein